MRLAVVGHVEWIRFARVERTPAAGEIFGSSVAAMGTDRVLIGASYENTGATAAGAAYLFNTHGVLLTSFTNPAPAADVERGRRFAVECLEAGEHAIGQRRQLLDVEVRLHTGRAARQVLVNRSGREFAVGHRIDEIARAECDVAAGIDAGPVARTAAVVGGGFVGRAPERNRANVGRLFDWWKAGALRPRVTRRWPLAEASEAIDCLRRRESVGKAFVVIAES